MLLLIVGNPNMCLDDIGFVLFLAEGSEIDVVCIWFILSSIHCPSRSL